ncbi:MAG: nucleotidyltransferase family protein [Casimicrobiaceae bacterium]
MTARSTPPPPRTPELDGQAHAAAGFANTSVQGGGWRPDDGQELLLAATIGPEAQAAQAFAQWRRAYDIWKFDAGTTRLLPLLVPRAHLFDDADPAWPMIRGLYRRAFVHGQLVARRAIDAMQRLAAAGIPTLALKGGALLAYYDHNPALRPMNDFDALVPRAHAESAIRLLQANGWHNAWPRTERLPYAYHGTCFASFDGLNFDLHWQVLAAAGDSDDAALWDASVECDVPGGTTRAPCAADLLTIVCAHAAPWSPDSPVRWVADALRIIRGQSVAFDWVRVVERARKWRVTLPLHDTLGYLAQQWQVDVPSAVLEALAATPVHPVDRRVHAALARKPGLGDYLARPWWRYRLISYRLPTWRAVPGFLRYLKLTLGQTRIDQLPREILRRIVRFRRGRQVDPP